MNEQVTLFDLAGEQQETKENIVENRLSVVRMEYLQAETLTWQELFSGFDRIHAITYSSGIDFVYRLLEKFDKAEVIFGCEGVLSYSISEILAYQSKLLELMREKAGKRKAALLKRIDEGEVRFFVARGKLSHEKLYLLEADDGRKRVIMGSANMSFQAFGGLQRENICYVDGNDAYEWYYEIFKELLQDSSDEITKNAFTFADIEENPEELPISHTVKTNKILVVEEPQQEAKESATFILDVRNLAGKIADLVPKAEKADKRRILISPDKVVKMKEKLQRDKIREKEQRSQYPQLVIDVEDGTARLNDKVLDLHPDAAEIKSDVEQFVKYMSGFENFHGDHEGVQLRYYEFANWFFCSPFMAPLRDAAARFDQNKLPYPVFGLVYGQSKAGKTSFLETLLLMMIGQKPKLSAPDFTRKTIEQLKRTVKGAPIIVDDLTNNRFNQHAIETIKNDDFGVLEHMKHYSAVVISANEDVKAVAQEVIRRTVICRVEAGLTNTEVLKSNLVRSVQRKIGTAFYREYLRRMLEVMPDMLDQLRSDEQESPDVLKVSSEIIYQIISDYLGSELPFYVRKLSLDNYFSERVTGKYAIKTIRNAWTTSKESFQINKRNNELRYNAGVSYEAERLIKELPETLEAHKSRDWVVMNLENAQDFFGLTFKKSWLPWA